MLPVEQPSSSANQLAAAAPTEPLKLPYNLLALNLLQLLTILLTCLAKNSPSIKASEASVERMGNTVDAFTSRGNDIIRCVLINGCYRENRRCRVNYFHSFGQITLKFGRYGQHQADYVSMIKPLTRL